MSTPGAEPWRCVIKAAGESEAEQLACPVTCRPELECGQQWWPVICCPPPAGWRATTGEDSGCYILQMYCPDLAWRSPPARPWTTHRSRVFLAEEVDNWVVVEEEECAFADVDGEVTIVETPGPTFVDVTDSIDVADGTVVPVTWC